MRVCVCVPVRVRVCVCVWVFAGMRDQPLDWETAPPVHVLSFLVLGSEKDARSEDVSLCLHVSMYIL